jgi:GAF domain-containing protein
MRARCQAGVIVHVDAAALQSSLRRLREAAFDADVVAVMERAVNAVHRVFGCSGAGIMFITESGHLSYVAASDEAGRQLEQAQAFAGQGPCYDSYVYGHDVISRDLRTDGRWPRLPARLPREVRAVAGIPVLLSGSPVGTLNVYRDQPDDWDKTDIQALRAYGDLIAEVVGTALAAQNRGALAEQLQYALDYRVVIERAVGYLMGSQSLDAVTAFNALRKRARDSRRRIADVAAEILATNGQTTTRDADG